MATFIDANVILRHITADHPTQSVAARSLIEDVEHGRETVLTTDVVIAEIVWVLTSRTLYAMSRDDVRDVLLPIIALPSFQLPGKHLYPRVFDIFVNRNVDYIDAFHAAQIEQRTPPHLFSFDREYDRIPTVTRIEPT